MLKFLLLLLFVVLLKEALYAVTSRMKSKAPKYRPPNSEDTMDYSKVRPVSAVISGKRYHFSSTAEYRYALYLETQKQEGKIAGWSYEETLFAFFQKPVRGSFNPAGITMVVYPSNGLSVAPYSKVKAYLPDFCITHLNGRTEYIEIKGRWTKRAETAVNNMKAFHPNVALSVKYV